MKSAKAVIYPAIADSVDLPEFSFRKNRDEDAFVLLTGPEQQLFLSENTSVYNIVATLSDLRLRSLLAPMWQEFAGLNITFNIVCRRAELLKIQYDGVNVAIEAHWNLFIPYFDHIKALPIVHPEVLDLFAHAVFKYAELGLKHPEVVKNELRGLVIDTYRVQPELLLTSLDIFNKANIYHIRPTRNWFNKISAANDKYRLQIDASAAT